jgi:hypothetical protein
MKLKSFFKKIWTFLTKIHKKATHLYDQLTTETQKLVPVAVHLVQALKTVTTDSKADDVVAAILGKLLPKYSTVITAYKCYLEEAIPKWLNELKVAQSIVQIEDKNEQLVAIINALNISDTKSTEYLEFATKCLYYLNGGEDGELGWEDCKGIVQEYYDTYVK